MKEDSQSSFFCSTSVIFALIMSCSLAMVLGGNLAYSKGLKVAQHFLYGHACNVIRYRSYST